MANHPPMRVRRVTRKLPCASPRSPATLAASWSVWGEHVPGGDGMLYEPSKEISIREWYRAERAAGVRA